MITVTVKFDGEVPSTAQAQAMMAFEKQLRILTGMDIRVFKERMADDSKLRTIIDMRRKK